MGTLSVRDGWGGRPLEDEESQETTLCPIRDAMEEGERLPDGEPIPLANCGATRLLPSVAEDRSILRRTGVERDSSTRGGEDGDGRTSTKGKNVQSDSSTGDT